MQNKKFRSLFNGFSAILPTLSGLVLTINYGGAALATYLFLQIELSEVLAPPTYSPYFAAILAACVGIGVQGFRGVIVYFDLLTPNKLSFSRVPEAIAVAFTLFTIVEVYYLVGAVGLSPVVVISLSGLQVAGLAAEVFLLRQFRYLINFDLASNPGKVLEIAETMVRIGNLEALEDKVKDAMGQDGVFIDGEALLANFKGLPNPNPNPNPNPDQTTLGH